MEILEWEKANPPKRKKSVLLNSEEQIKELYDKGYQVEQIEDFLQNVKKIKVVTRTIYRVLNLKNFSLKNPQQLVVEKKVIEKKESDGSMMPTMEEILARLN